MKTSNLIKIIAVTGVAALTAAISSCNKENGLQPVKAKTDLPVNLQPGAAFKDSSGTENPPVPPRHPLAHRPVIASTDSSGTENPPVPTRHP